MATQVQQCSYAAIDSSGKRITGNMDASGRDEVVDKLKNEELIITKISCGVTTNPLDSDVMTKRLSIIPQSINSEDLMVFTRELATMINAGLPLVESLYTIAEDIEKDKMKKVVQDLGTKIIGGISFSEALKMHKNVFDDMFINLVKVGEIGGNLEVILVNLADYMEAMEELKRKIYSALYYPITVITFALLIVSGLFIFVIPRFAEIFSNFGSELPTLTKFFLDASMFMQKYYIPLFVALAVGIYVFLKFIKTKSGRNWFDRLKLTMPLVGPLVNKIVISRFAKILALLYSSGVPINQSLELVSSACGNSVMEAAILKANENVLEGESISGTLEKSKIFPVMVIHMMDVGEQTGNLSEMLNKISQFYDMQVNTSIRGLTSLIEPVLVVFMGILIGFMALSLFLPIVKLPTIIAT